MLAKVKEREEKERKRVSQHCDSFCSKPAVPSTCHCPCYVLRRGVSCRSCRLGSRGAHCSSRPASTLTRRQPPNKSAVRLLMTLFPSGSA